ncbi:MAG: hypothetical protein Q9179_001775 [Wetmoreana sp. 5 TL-2023]
MRSACILSALVAIAAAAPAPAPQAIDLAGVDAAPDPQMVSAPLGVESDQPLKKRDATLNKRDGNCAVQPAGAGPVPSPDTVEAFRSSSDLQQLATNALTPDGYSQAFSNADGSLSASKYMGLHTLKSFDTLGCASLCDQADGCEAFNMYIERDPSVDPNANDCPNPPSTINYKCTLWGAPVVAEEATNKGQWRDSFQVVITGSNGYNKASPPDPIDGFNGPTELGGAINAPLDNGKNTYLGYKYFPFSQSQGYDPATCAAACKAQTAYNSRHPNADGSFATCSFFNAYVLSQNAIPQGLYCSLYSKAWAKSYATNHGQYRDSDRFTPLDLTTALRPSLLPDETLLFVQDGVGLYEGKFKIPAFQNGHAYLTSHRACYVDNAEPRKNSIAVDLKAVERYDLYAGFLKSSPKITFFPKVSKKSTPIQASYASIRNATASPEIRDSSPSASSQSLSGTPRAGNPTWICAICSFSNPVPANFDPASANVHTPVPPCSACGIKPSFAHILKVAIAAASGRSTANHSPVLSFNGSRPRHGPSHSDTQNGRIAGDVSPLSLDSKFQCPRCTFQNHPSLLECELCGAPLILTEDAGYQKRFESPLRPESPGPSLDSQASSFDKNLEGIKFSFRAGGEKVFYERLKGAMTQRKWLLQNAPPIPRANQPLHNNVSPAVAGQPLQHSSGSQSKIVGIAGLERRGLELRKNNETVLGNAFEDLEALMASAKEIVALAETFARQSADKGSEGVELLEESATALGMITTKDMLGTKTGSDSLYLSELSRNLAEYLTDDAKGILRREGGIMSLVDLWAVFNRSRGGVELISPADFERAARLWDKLSLPVRLRQFKNGLLVVQRYDWTDDKTIAQLLAWLQEGHVIAPDGDLGWDWRRFGRGVTAQEAATRFGWSIGVASEELEMAEERGALCRDEGVEGIRFWENWFLHGDDGPYEHRESTTSLAELEL